MQSSTDHLCQSQGSGRKKVQLCDLAGGQLMDKAGTLLCVRVKSDLLKYHLYTINLPFLVHSSMSFDKFVQPLPHKIQNIFITLKSSLMFLCS